MISEEMLVSNLIGVAIGGVIGLAVAWGFHRRGLRESDRCFTILARFLEQFAGAAIPEGRPIKVTFSRDSKGRITNAHVAVTVGRAVEHDEAPPVTPAKKPPEKS